MGPNPGDGYYAIPATHRVGVHGEIIMVYILRILMAPLWASIYFLNNMKKCNHSKVELVGWFDDEQKNLDSYRAYFKCLGCLDNGRASYAACADIFWVSDGHSINEPPIAFPGEVIKWK